MQKYAEEAIKEHMAGLQKTFFSHWKGKVPWGKHDEVIEEGMKRSDRYKNLKDAGWSDGRILKNFNEKIPMTVFSWRGDRDTVMSPMDSMKYYKMFLQTGFMSMDPTNGHIKAWVGGVNYQHFKYDHVREGRRQVGSTFKPFVYAIAMQEGYSPCQKIPNLPVEIPDGKGGIWIPHNSDNSNDGKMLTLKQALAGSVNRISAYLIKQFGPQAVIDMARKMGITSPIDPVPSICLGTADLSVFEMVGAYSTFANKGIWTEPVFLTRIEDKNGNILQNFVPKKIEAIDENTAYLMLNLLEGVVSYGTGARLRSVYKLEGPMGGKTGTTQNNSDGWFMGVTPSLVSGAWVGCEDRSVHFRTTDLGQGATMALPIWGLYMKKVLNDKSITLPVEKFEYPSGLGIETDCSKYKQEEENESEENEF
jgi:penicillin-binding protein 1A